MFRGNAPARIDDKGRLKVPNAFRSLLETKYGRELFLTSLSGEYVRIYPMPVWLEIEQKPDELIITNGARVRSFTPGQKSVVSVPSGVADQKSGWHGRQYVIEIRPQLGPSSQERYRLSDDGKRLFVTIRIAGEGRNRSLTVERVYDRASAIPHALPGSD